MGDQISTAFETFHRNNPHVYPKIRELAITVKESGKRNFGIAAIFERLRWLSTFETRDDAYKLNNNYRAFYVRMLMREEPSLQGFFRVRGSQADMANGNQP